VTRRLPHILLVLIRHGIAQLVAPRAVRWPWLLRWVPLAGLNGPQRFRRLFEDLGGSFIKFGQMLALQPDIVSLEYCDELFNLLDRIAPFPFAHVEQVFQEELGRSPAEIFEQFETEPLATARSAKCMSASCAAARSRSKCSGRASRPTSTATSGC
jgi:ubiquinone biosynthesis protein